jgi:HSP20 family protein
MTQVIFKPVRRKPNFDKIYREFPDCFDLPFNNFPRVDVIEDDKSIRLFVELPGVNKEDVKIILEDGVLTLNGEKTNELDDTNKINVFRNERMFGKFERKFKMPEDINPDKVTARFERGLLKITVAKLLPEEPKERIIEVK